MDWSSTLSTTALIGVIFFFSIGYIGVFVPFIPGTIIVWLAIIGHRLWLGDASVSKTFLAVATVLMLSAQIGEYLCTLWGARRFGASWRGAVGALLGLLIGPFVLTPIPGIIIGPMLGVIIGELLGGMTLRSAGKASFGTLVGSAIAVALKFGIVTTMITGFFLSAYL